MNSRMIKILLPLLLLSIIVILVVQNSSLKKASIDNLPEPTVTMESVKYKVTKEEVSQAELEAKIGKITEFYAVVSYLEGNEPFKSPVGNKVYKLKGYDSKEIIAVKLNDKFYRAEVNIDVIVPGTPEADATELARYFPPKNMKMIYNGGFEGGGYSITTEFIEGNRLQTKEISTGTRVVAVYTISEEAITIIFTKEESGQERNYINAASNTNRIVLKGPIKVGTTWATWEQGERRQSTITGVGVEVLTPAGRYNAVEVTTTIANRISKDYYAQDIGLVKSTYKAGDFEKQSELIKVEENSENEISDEEMQQSNNAKHANIPELTVVEIDELALPIFPVGTRVEVHWTHPFVIHNGFEYKILIEKEIPLSQIGREIGEVKGRLRSSYIFTGKWPVAEEGESNHLQAGSKLYECKGKDIREAIIVEDKDSYWEAVKVSE